MQKSKQTWVQVVSLIFLVTIAYANSIPAVFVSDDVHSILQNTQLGNFSIVLHSPANFFQPLLYFIIYVLFGPTASAFRIVNILFHIGSVILVYFIVKQIWNKNIALICAAIFAVHPILTESIVWISGGHYVLYGFFFLLSFFFYLKSAKNPGMLWLSLVSYFFSLESSSLAVSLPLVLLLYTLLTSKDRKQYMRLIPFFALTLTAVLFIVVSGLSGRLSYMSDFLSHYASNKSYYNYNPLLLIPLALSTYLQLIFLPLQLSFYHSEIFTYAQVAIRILICLFFIALIIFSYKKNKQIFFWLSYFVITLLLVISPLQLSSASIAERYVYVATLGIIAPLSYFLYQIIKKSPAFGWSILGIILILLTLRTVIRNTNWLTYNSFWISTLATAPFSYQAHMNVGSIYFQNGEYNAAIDEFKKSLLLQENAQTHYNLATAYYGAKRLPEALDQYQKSLHLDPSLPETYQNIAAIYFQQNDLAKSEEMTKKALKMSPNNINVMVNLGIIYLKEGRKPEAKQVFQQILSVDPNNAEAQRGLAASSK